MSCDNVPISDIMAYIMDYRDMEDTCPAQTYSAEQEHCNYDECSTDSTMTTGTTPLESAVLICHIFFTIVPILFSVAFTVVAARKLQFSSDSWRFLLEFVIIVIPIILNVTVCNSFVEGICVVPVIVLFWLYKRGKLGTDVQNKSVISLGRQPVALTLLRSTINIITAVCILAIDFSVFPKKFRKSSKYGVGLMDTGIGLFVFSMGVVSRPPRLRSDFLKIPKMVGPALILGLARTIVIQAIDYHQDEKEYGLHMNAFFTLGLTKLFGGLISAVAISNYLLLILGFIILAAHECVLQYGLAEYVMDPSLERETFFLANREGIVSLPGFIGIYLIAMYISRTLFSETTLVVEEYKKKVKRLALIACCSWIFLFIYISTFGISRRVANLGYATWTFSIAMTMLMFYIILFDFAFYVWSETEEYKLPSIMDATNRNGLVFFLVANILTGCVNIFLSPEDRSEISSIVILCAYMLLSSSLVYILLRLRIKIA